MRLRSIVRRSRNSLAIASALNFSIGLAFPAMFIADGLYRYAALSYLGLWLVTYAAPALLYEAMRMYIAGQWKRGAWLSLSERKSMRRSAV
jgi:hypothetical protein